MKKMCIVAFIVAGFVVFLYLQSNTVKKAKINAKVAFINQVRGGECCQKGSYEFAQRQLELFKKHHFPATFVLRYDALVDTQFINLFKSYSNDRFEYGVFLEITPQLAKDAGVLYKGTEDRWYRAQYAYLVGYSQDERKKLIDVVMNQYKRQFGVFPKITGGWMLDTFSAEYLTSVYQIQAHEITREQWGTDGYALYGGPILSAYAPSKKWLFMPAQSEEDSLPLLVLRQTLSDPVRNYGDLTSGYTSQPNDYGRTKNFSYFKHILNQVEDYSQPIAILGLENSLEKKYQDAYEKQVEYVSQVVENKNVILPVPSVISEINDINFSSGTDFSDSSYKSFWIESQKYRVRIIQKDGLIQITDLRVFNESLSDPFFAASTGEKTAFWEIPFIFDSSKFGKRIEVNAFTIKVGELFRFFGNEDWIRERTNPVVNEQFLQEVNGITLPSLKKNTTATIKELKGAITFHYLSQGEREVIISFLNEGFLVNGVSPNEYNIKGDIGKNTQLLQGKNRDGILFTPQYVAKEIVENEKVESSPSPKPSEISLIYNAPLSLIGRNPVRLVIVSKDSAGAPARVQNIQLTHTKGSFDSIQIHETEGHLGEFDGMYYVDIEKNIPGTYTPILTIDSQKQVLQPISFIFDCKKNIKTCLQNPQELFDYIKVKVGDILNRR